MTTIRINAFLKNETNSRNYHWNILPPFKACMYNVYRVARRWEFLTGQLIYWTVNPAARAQLLNATGSTTDTLVLSQHLCRFVSVFLASMCSACTETATSAVNIQNPKSTPFHKRKPNGQWYGDTLITKNCSRMSNMTTVAASDEMGRRLNMLRLHSSTCSMEISCYYPKLMFTFTDR